MASFSVAAGEVGAHAKMLTAATVDTVTFAQDLERVEVSHDGAGDVRTYFTVDGSTPTVGGLGTYELQPYPDSLIVEVPTAGNTVVKLISSGTPKYSVSKPPLSRTGGGGGGGGASGEVEITNALLSVEETGHKNDVDTWLVSGARSTTQTGADQPNSYARALGLFLDITASPNNADTLTVSIEAKDPTSGKYREIAAFTAITASNVGAAPTTATFLFVLDPDQDSLALTSGAGGRQVIRGRLPAVWRPKITVSAASSWTYGSGFYTGI